MWCQQRGWYSSRTSFPSWEQHSSTILSCSNTQACKTNVQAGKPKRRQCFCSLPEHTGFWEVPQGAASVVLQVHRVNVLCGGRLIIRDKKQRQMFSRVFNVLCGGRFIIRDKKQRQMFSRVFNPPVWGQAGQHCRPKNQTSGHKTPPALDDDQWAKEEVLLSIQGWFF